ncbi:MAG: MBL fold metallo-hydrolase [Bacteroidota bacterium]|nr:MBL fold metallo-hydrolase [Bacteroidota bacterium]MDP4190603.1 MBL fold metallo-hydrolase [Bacteroidota bacterium]MDP4195056.1 MBL fold metallo-hydrolase [Bacteroidota bacterium]
MKQIIPLEINFTYQDSRRRIYPVLLTNKDEVILVDCGYPGFLPLIKEEAEKNDIDLNNLSTIVITHHDYDHMGALAEIKEEYPKVTIASSLLDEKYISGKEKSLRLQQAEALYDTLPFEKRAHAEWFQNTLKSLRTAKVDLKLNDHDIMPWAGGTEIIATPGHMPGHISLYIKNYKTLIAGDALVIEEGKLAIANPNYTLDISEAKRSVKKLLDYEIQRIICYHGGEFNKNIRDSLLEVIKEA